MRTTFSLVLLLLNTICFAQIKDLKNLSGSLPTSKARIFAPEKISVEGRYEFGITFSEKGDKIIFSGQTGQTSEPVLYLMNYEKDTWSSPKALNLTPNESDGEMEAFFYDPNDELYFVSCDSFARCEIWVADIEQAGFSNAKKLDSPINEKMVFYPTLTKKGKLYYTDILNRRIAISEKEENKYLKLIDPKIPFGGHAFIAPDESFALVDWKGDIYITYKKEKWTEPVKLNNQVCSEYSESCPALSPDGKYLFFSRYNEPNNVSNIYWIEFKHALN